MNQINLILGTAGHIDHGKTTLIRALTGVETDRLPEEQKRGITIELGFAHLDLEPFQFGIVDVPGHEKFVRTMLAGATGMDLAMLVVAADDSIKQQTREHLDILRLLQLPGGVIALTKCDLVDEDWLDLVEEEVRDLVRETTLADAPIVRTSAMSARGIEELKAALRMAAERAVKHRVETLHAPFRMAIDRSFSIVGHGTVVTGSVVSGTARVGDEMELAPGQVKVRIRGLQNHDHEANEVHRGQRAAINLVGVHHNETERGQEVVAPGSLVPSQILTVRLRNIGTIPRPLKDRSKLRLHLGTSEQLATLRLVEGQPLEAGQATIAQLRLPEPVVASWRQPFVVRSESPVQTVGGGIVLDPEASPIKELSGDDRRSLEELEKGEPRQRVEATLQLRGFRDWRSADLFRLAGVDDPTELLRELMNEGTLVSLELSPQRNLIIHHLAVERLSRQLHATLERLHDTQPLRLVFPTSELTKRFAYLPDKKVIHLALGVLRKNKLLRSSEKGVGLTSRGPKLSQNEVKLLEQLVQQLAEAGGTPPTVKQLEQGAAKNKDSVRQLLQLAAGQGDLVEVSRDYYYHAKVTDALWHELLVAFEAQGGMTVSQIKDTLGFSRKYAVPFCEYLDSVHLTRREGDLRYPVASTAGDGSE